MTAPANDPSSSSPAPPTTAGARSNSTALLTDRYELTMLQAPIADGTVDRSCVFEVFARRLPAGRRYGVVAGTARLVQAITEFCFADDELQTLRPFLDKTTL